MQICNNADLTIKLFDSLETCQSSDDYATGLIPFTWDRVSRIQDSGSVLWFSFLCILWRVNWGALSIWSVRTEVIGIVADQIKHFVFLVRKSMRYAISLLTYAISSADCITQPLQTRNIMFDQLWFQSHGPTSKLISCVVCKQLKRLHTSDFADQKDK
jgi:hypothetical protein